MLLVWLNAIHQLLLLEDLFLNLPYLVIKAVASVCLLYDLLLELDEVVCG